MLALTVKGTPPQFTVVGEIDLSNAPELVAKISRQAARGLPIIVDLSGVTYFDSSGVQALTQLKKQFGEDLQVIPSDRVRRILDITGLAALLLR